MEIPCKPGKTDAKTSKYSYFGLKFQLKAKTLIEDKKNSTAC